MVWWPWVPFQAHGGQLSELTHRMARLGTGGKFPNNAERDLANLLHLPIIPYWINIVVRNPTDRKSTATMRCPILFPHEVYHYLHEPNLDIANFWGTCCVHYFQKIKKVFFTPKKLSMMLVHGVDPRPVGNFALIGQRSNSFGRRWMTPHTQAHKNWQMLLDYMVMIADTMGQGRNWLPSLWIVSFLKLQDSRQQTV